MSTNDQLNDENFSPGNERRKSSTPKRSPSTSSSPLQIIRNFASLSNRGSPSPLKTPFGELFRKGSGEKTTPDKTKNVAESTQDDKVKEDQFQHSLCASTAQVPSVSGNVTAAADVSASRYDAIASLDEAQYNEEERWRDRTELITKYDHEEYQSYAQGIIHEVVDTLVIVENGSKDEIVESYQNDATVTNDNKKETIGAEDIITNSSLRESANNSIIKAEVNQEENVIAFANNKYRLDDSIIASEETESEYESANEQSFDGSFSSPQKDFIDVKQVKVNEDSSFLGVDSITDVLAGMKIYSTGKKIDKEDHPNTSDEIFKNDDDETDTNLDDDDDSREKTPVPPKFNVKPSEIDDLAAQLNANVNVSSDSEVQFNIKPPADTSFQSVSNEAEFSISDADGASKICSDEVLVSIARTPNVPANMTTKLIKSSENTNNTTPKDAEQRIQAQEPSAPHKNENDENEENSNTEPRDPVQVDTIKKHLFDSPIPTSKNEDTPKLVSTPKIGTPLNVSFKNTPTNSSLKKVKSGNGICIGNDGTPVDVPKLRPGNEPPTPPNKNEVATNVPDEEVRTIKKTFI